MLHSCLTKRPKYCHTSPCHYLALCHVSWWLLRVQTPGLLISVLSLRHVEVFSVPIRKAVLVNTPVGEAPPWQVIFSGCIFFLEVELLGGTEPTCAVYLTYVVSSALASRKLTPTCAAVCADDTLLRVGEEPCTGTHKTIIGETEN